MEPDNLLPDNDRNLNLARLIEEIRKTGDSPESIDDPLMPLLLQYKNADKVEFRHTSPDSSSIWDRIKRNLEADQPPIYRLLPSTKALRWVAVAAVVILSLTMFYWLFDRSQPELIAATQQSISEVTLEDGSTVTLRPHTTLHRLSYSANEHVYAISGEAYFEVTQNPNRTFIAETNNGRVVVLGTKFMLQNWTNGTTVFLEEGRVRFETTDKSASTLLNPGELSEIIDNKISEPVLENSRVHKDWLENVLVMENQQVDVVLSEIEQHFNVSIEASEAPDETLGGSIQLDNLKQVLQDLSIVLGGSFEQTSEYAYKYIPQN